MEIDKLVSLLESPIFIHLRLQLLRSVAGGGEEARFQASLLKSLYGVLMILPQSEAFRTLKARLGSVTALHQALSASTQYAGARAAASPPAGGGGAGAVGAADPGQEARRRRRAEAAAGMLRRFVDLQGEHRRARAKALSERSEAARMGGAAAYGGGGSGGTDNSQ